MNILQIGELIGALGLVEFIKWLITYLTHRSHEKQMKETEVDKAKSDVGKSKVAEEKALRVMYEETLSDMRKEFQERIADMRKEFQERIADLQQANSALSKQNLELLKAGARKDDIIEDKKEQIRKIQDLRVEDTKRIGRLEKGLMHYKNWHCQREEGDGKEQCNRRKPHQNPPLKFKDIEEDD